MHSNEIRQLEDYGFIFKNYSHFIDTKNITKMANDAQLITPANSAIPVEYTAFLDPTAVRILTSPTRARQIGNERKLGDWTTPYTRFTLVEQTGFTQPYDDYANNGVSDINPTFPTRDNYIFETTIMYGDRESDIAGRARINLASEKQRSAATTIDIAMNKFYFYGVANLQNYGILNDPTLPPTLTPSDGTAWSTKSSKGIYEDILRMAEDVAERSDGLVDTNSSMTLVVSPATNIRLAQATDFNISVIDMLAKGLPNLRIVTAPEMATDAGNLVMLIADRVDVPGDETRTLDLIYSEKMRAGRVVAKLSHYHQKFTAGTYGALFFRPFLVSLMLGV